MLRPHSISTRLAALAVVIGVVVYLKKKAQAAKPPAAGVEVQSVKVENI